MSINESSPASDGRQHTDADLAIDLTDLLIAVWRRRWVFLVTFAVVFGLCIAYAFFNSPKYEYRATIEIGHVTKATESSGASSLREVVLQPIEQTESLRNRLEMLHIPDVVHQYRQANPEAPRPPEIQVNISDGQELVTLTAKGPKQHSERNLQLLGRIANRVIKEHGKIFQLAEAEQRAQLTSARNQLESMQSREEVVKADIERIDKKGELLKEDIESLEASVEGALTQRQDVAETASDAEKAMTLLMIDSQIQNERRRLDELQHNLEVQLEQERDELSSTLSDNLRAQETQQQRITALETKTGAMTPTRVVIPPIRSLDPVPPGRKLIVLIGFLLAVVLALLAVAVSTLAASTADRLHENEPH